VNSPSALSELRRAFNAKDMGDPEREVTYALFHRLMGKYWEEKKIWSIFLFASELTCAHGMVRERLVWIPSLLLLVFTLPYIGALRRREGAGISVKWPEGKAERITREFFFPNVQEQSASRWWGLWFRRLCALLIGLYFSFQSSVGIPTPWGILNLGLVLKRLQPRDYDLYATGWVKVVAGLQSLIGLGLVLTGPSCWSPSLLNVFL
jgi:hypothetical protein